MEDTKNGAALKYHAGGEDGVRGDNLQEPDNLVTKRLDEFAGAVQE